MGADYSVDLDTTSVIKRSRIIQDSNSVTIN